MSDAPVYCSGPMFSVGDLYEQASIATTLEGAGYTTYLPQRDGLEVGKIMAVLHRSGMPSDDKQRVIDRFRQCVFALDVFQLLKRCGPVVFNLDGRVPDDGSVVETAAAFAAGKPILIYKSTPVTMLAGEDNPMVQFLSPAAYCTDMTQIPTLLAGVIEQTPPYDYAPPSYVGAQIDTGEKVWALVSTWRAVVDDLDALLKLLDEIASLLPPPPVVQPS